MAAPWGGPLAGVMCTRRESYVTGPANIRGGGQDVGRVASGAHSGSGPRGGMRSGEIRSDYLINRWRLPEGAIKISLELESRKDRGVSGDACKGTRRAGGTMEFGVVRGPCREGLQTGLEVQ